MFMYRLDTLKSYALLYINFLFCQSIEDRPSLLFILDHKIEQLKVNKWSMEFQVWIYDVHTVA